MSRKHPDLLAAAAYLVVGLAWVWSMPDLARLDRDEGFNIMKAALVEHGYRLYSQIWSDQPPLFTYLLLGWRKLFGPGDTAARSLVVLMTGFGLAAVGRIATRLGRTPRAGLLAIALLIAARSYPKLSMSVMIGLPAISVALLSVWLIILATRWRHGWIAMLLGGALFACSMQIKLFTFILAPMACYLAVTADRRDSTSIPRRKGRIALDLGLLLAGFAVVTLLIGPFRDPAWRQQLVRTHLKTGLPTDDTQLASLKSILMRFLEDGPLMVAFFTTMILAGRDNFRRCLPVVIWMGTSLLVLSQANPLWGHHRVMFSIPAAIMTAVAVLTIVSRPAGVSAGLEQAWKRQRGMATIAVGVALGWGTISLVYAMINLGREPGDLLDSEVLAQINSRKPRTQWIISDDPHIVHKAGLLVPPETAVLSWKRLQRDFTEDRFAQIIEQYQPNILLLARHPYTQPFIDRVTAGYTLVLKKNKDRVKLYLRDAAIDGENKDAPGAIPGASDTQR